MTVGTLLAPLPAATAVVAHDGDGLRVRAAALMADLAPPAEPVGPDEQALVRAVMDNLAAPTRAALNETVGDRLLREAGPFLRALTGHACGFGLDLLCRQPAAGEAVAGRPTASDLLRERLTVRKESAGHVSVAVGDPEPARAAALANLAALAYVQERVSAREALHQQILARLAELRAAGEQPATDLEGLVEPTEGHHQDLADRLQALLASDLWRQPAARVVVPAAQPVPSWFAGGPYGMALAGLASLVLTLLLCTLVNALWPVGVRETGLLSNPYWPATAPAAAPARPREDLFDNPHWPHRQPEATGHGSLLPVAGRPVLRSVAGQQGR